MDVVERQIENLARITDELLDSSRIVSGTMRLQRTSLDLVVLVESAVSDYRAVATSAGVQLQGALPDTPVWVEGDAMRLAQLVGNLLANAVKFTPARGHILVSLVIQGDSVAVRVRDTGVGMDAAFLPHAFESFAQEDKTLERARGGLGLGLAIARSLAQAHGGGLEAESEGRGRGTEVTLRLPRLVASSGGVESPIQAPASTRALRILIVEDNADAAESLKMVLELAGHTVQVAGDGEAGVRLACLTRPELVLCDVGLPLMDGYQVAGAIRADPTLSGVHLIAVTGYGSDDARQRALEAGFDEHLTKPVAPEVLLQKLTLGRKRVPAV